MTIVARVAVVIPSIATSDSVKGEERDIGFGKWDALQHTQEYGKRGKLF